VWKRCREIENFRELGCRLHLRPSWRKVPESAHCSKTGALLQDWRTAPRLAHLPHNDVLLHSCGIPLRVGPDWFKHLSSSCPQLSRVVAFRILDNSAPARVLRRQLSPFLGTLHALDPGGGRSWSLVKPKKLRWATIWAAEDPKSGTLGPKDIHCTHIAKPSLKES
jgi:hypothetical protein